MLNVLVMIIRVRLGIPYLLTESGDSTAETPASMKQRFQSYFLAKRFTNQIPLLNEETATKSGLNTQWNAHILRGSTMNWAVWQTSKTALRPGL